MTSITISPAARPLAGILRPPGDKSISHRALLLAALAEGTSTLTGLSNGDDVLRTRAAIAALGARVTDDGDGTTVDGGRARLRGPDGDIDVGNSGTAIRLLAGYCSPIPGRTTLVGDESVSRRPMDRVVEPLRRMGAEIDAAGEGRFPPLRIEGRELQGIEYTLPVASAQVKGAVLLAGLAASGETVVREPVPTRAHTEEMLTEFGANVLREGDAVSVRASALSPREFAVASDPSQAAFWAVAAAIVPGSDVQLTDVYLGAARGGFVDVLRRMGAEIDVVATGEHRFVLRVRGGELRATDVLSTEVPGLIDEIPVLAVAAARATGTTTFSGAGELRLKESDRIDTIAGMLGAFGVKVETTEDGLSIDGSDRMFAATVDSRGDHRIAMAGAVASLVADGETTIEGWDAVDTSYPGFLDDLAVLLGESRAAHRD